MAKKRGSKGPKRPDTTKNLRTAKDIDRPGTGTPSKRPLTKATRPKPKPPKKAPSSAFSGSRQTELDLAYLRGIESVGGAEAEKLKRTDARAKRGLKQRSLLRGTGVKGPKK